MPPKVVRESLLENNIIKFDAVGTCYIEVGAGNVAELNAKFLGDAEPQVTLNGPLLEFSQRNSYCSGKVLIPMGDLQMGSALLQVTQSVIQNTPFDTTVNQKTTPALTNTIKNPTTQSSSFFLAEFDSRM
jgi:hypothetical protein